MLPLSNDASLSAAMAGYSTSRLSSSQLQVGDARQCGVPGCQASHIVYVSTAPPLSLCAQL